MLSRKLWQEIDRKNVSGALRTRKGENEVQLERNEGDKELNLVKKAVIRKYIQSIFPECRGKESFAKVVDAINEGLRRPEEKKRDKNENYMYNNEVVVEIHEGELGALDETDYLEDDLFTDGHSFDNL